MYKKKSDLFIFGLLNFKTSLCNLRKQRKLYNFLLHFFVSQNPLVASHCLPWNLYRIVLCWNVIVISRLLNLEWITLLFLKFHLSFLSVKCFSNRHCVNQKLALFIFVVWVLILIKVFRKFLWVWIEKFLLFFCIFRFSLPFHHLDRIQSLYHTHWISSFERSVDRSKKTILIFG